MTVTRIPEYGPMLDQVGEVAFVDPEPASIRHLQRIDRRVHALYTEWGGPGLWVPCWMDQSETPDEMEISLPVPPGVELFRVRALVSQRDKTTPKRAEVELSVAGGTTGLTWQELSGGNTLEGAIEVATSGVDGGDNGPLRVNGGYSWAWTAVTVTVTFDVGTGKLWGLLFQPIHDARPA